MGEGRRSRGEAEEEEEEEETEACMVLWRKDGEER